MLLELVSLTAVLLLELVTLASVEELETLVEDELLESLDTELCVDCDDEFEELVDSDDADVVLALLTLDVSLASVDEDEEFEEALEDVSASSPVVPNCLY